MSQGRSIVLMVMAATALWGQEGRLSVSDPSWKGIEVQFLTKVEPPGDNPRGQLGEGVTTDEGRAHHYIMDAAHKRYFGYDLRLEPSGDGNSAQLQIEPLTTSGHRITVGPGWTLTSLPKYPVGPNVRVGDTVAIDLLKNPATGQKIVAYLTLKRGGNIVRPRELRDFSLADVEMFLDRPRVTVKGKLVEATANTETGMEGRVVWLYLAGHGRFVLSLFPDERLGFHKNGVVEGNVITLRDGPAELRVECRARITPGPGLYNLYVLQEPGWRPFRKDEPFEFGSADKAEYVVGRDWHE